MPDHKEIYDHHAETYDRLIAREDHRGNIPRALLEIHPFCGSRVAELGAGTGRLTRILAPLADRICFFDASAAMLSVAVRSLKAMGAHNGQAAAADHRRLPLPSGVADVAISGWSLCYLAVWSGDGWRAELTKGLREMERVLCGGGTIVLLETLGTGNEEPQVYDKLRAYYDFLAEEGFEKRWIRTDYAFESPEEAATLVGFFFGEEMAARVTQQEKPRLPECTGIWWKRTP